MVNWKKVGLVAGVTAAIGAYPVTKGVQAAYRVIDAYRNAANRVDTAQRLPFDVPEDGSVGLRNCAEAEGMNSRMERWAYLNRANRGMIGAGWQSDSEGNMWRPVKRWDSEAGKEYTAPETIDFDEWHGGLPKGRKVNLPDVNGDGYVGSLGGLNDYRNRNKREMEVAQRSELRTVMRAYGGRR